MSSPFPPPTPPYAAPRQVPPTYQAPGHGAGGPVAPRTNPVAVVALVCSLVGVLALAVQTVTGGGWLGLAPGVAGAVCGHVALAQTGRDRRAGLPTAGRGMAVAAIVLGWAVVAFAVLVVLAFVAAALLMGLAAVA